MRNAVVRAGIGLGSLALVMGGAAATAAPTSGPDPSAQASAAKPGKPPAPVKKALRGSYQGTMLGDFPTYGTYQVTVTFTKTAAGKPRGAVRLHKLGCTGSWQYMSTSKTQEIRMRHVITRDPQSRCMDVIPMTAYLLRGGKLLATFDTGDYRHLRVVLAKVRS